MAPDWFLNLLPCCPLDGELWAGRGNCQLCRSICAGDAPDPRFDRIQYAVYSTPALPYVFADGEIKNANMHRTIKLAEVESWISDRLDNLPDFAPVNAPVNFGGELAFLCKNIPVQDDRVFLHRQVQLPQSETDARGKASAFLEKVLCLVAFCSTGVVGCQCRAKKNPWLAAVCALGCVAWTVLIIYSLFTWLTP